MERELEVGELGVVEQLENGDVWFGWTLMLAYYIDVPDGIACHGMSWDVLGCRWGWLCGEQKLEPELADFFTAAAAAADGSGGDSWEFIINFHFYALRQI